MIEHIIGICHDNHIHLDLIDILLLGGGLGGLRLIWWYVKGRFKDLIGKNENS